MPRSCTAEALASSAPDLTYLYQAAVPQGLVHHVPFCANLLPPEPASQGPLAPCLSPCRTIQPSAGCSHKAPRCPISALRHSSTINHGKLRRVRSPHPGPHPGRITRTRSDFDLADFVFVDEHNRHKRLKGRRASQPRSSLVVTGNCNLTNFVSCSYESLRRMPTKEDQVRCCHHEYLAMFCLHSPQTSLRSPQWLRWRGGTSSFRAHPFGLRDNECPRFPSAPDYAAAPYACRSSGHLYVSP